MITQSASITGGRFGKLHRLIPATLGLALMMAVSGVNAATVASWTNASLNASGSISAGTGTGTITRGSGVTYVNTANVHRSTSWNTTAGGSTAPTFGNDYVDIAVDTTGYTNITLLFSDQRDANGPAREDVYYSTTGTGGTFTIVGTAPMFTPANGTTNARTVDLSSISAMNNNPNVVFRIHGYNAATTGGYLQFSTISVTGSSDKFFIVDTADTIVYKYNESLAAAANWATSAANTNATGVAADDTYVYVLDSTDKQVYRYAYTGGTPTASRVLRTTGGAALGATLNSVAVYGDELWVADDSNNIIYKYSVATAFGGGGNYSATSSIAFAGGNSQSQGLAADGAYLYVLDQNDDLIYRYDKAAGGTPTASRPYRTTGGGAVGTGNGIAVDGDVLYVVQDAATDTVYTYSLTNLYTGTGNLSATAQTNLPAANGNPAGIAVNPAPAVSSITRADTSPTSSSSVTFTVTFSESVTGVGTGDFSLVTSGVSGASITSVSSDSGNVRTVTVNTGSGNGTIGLNFVDDDSALDIGAIAVGGTGTANGNFTGEVYTIDRTAPTCSSVNRASSSPTNATTLNFTVTFSEAVSNVTAARFAKTGTLSGVGTIGTPTTGDGGITWTVPVTGVSGNGTLGIDKTSNTGVADTAGNALTGGNVTGQQYTVDQTAPTCTSITLADTNPTSATTLNFTVTFSEAVTGVAAGRFTVTGTLTGTIGTPTTSDGGTTWNVPVTGVAGNGTLGINKTSNTSVTDLAGNALTGGNVTGALYTVATVDKFFVVDTADDTVYRYNEFFDATTNWATSAANGSPTGIAADDSYVYVLDTTDKIVYRYAYTGGTATASRVLRDEAGNALGATLNSIAVDGDDLWLADDSNNQLFRYSIATAFSGGGNYTALTVYNFGFGNSQSQGLGLDSTYLYVLDAQDVVIYRYSRASGGTPTASRVFRTTSGAAISGANGMTVEGDNVYVVQDGATDVAYRYSLTSLYTGSGNLSALEEFTLPSANGNPAGIAVNPNPAVSSIVRASANPTTAASVTFTVTFSESVTGVGTADFTLVTSGITGASITSVSADSGQTRTVTVNTGTGTGTIGLNFVDDDSVVDGSNLPIGGTGAGNGNFTGEVYTVDKVAPTCLTITRADANPTNASTVNFTVTFSEAVTNVTAARFSRTGTLSATGTIGTPTTSDGGTTWNVPVTGVTGTGTFGIDKTSNTGVTDTAGNALTGANVVGSLYNIDQTAPTLTSITLANTSPTSATTLNFTATFSEAVSGVVAARFATAVTGGVTGTIGTPTTSDGGITWNIPVTGVSGSGTLGVNKTTNTGVTDSAGNALTGGTVTGSVYTVDTVAPTVSSINRADADPTNATTVNFTVTFSESVTGVSASNFSVVGSGVTGSLGTVTGSGTTWNVPVTSVSGNGTIKVNLSANLSNIKDSVFNPLSAAFTTGQSYTVDQVAPTVSSINRTNTNPTSATTVNFTVTFSESVTGVGAGNFSLVGSGVAGTIGTVTGSGTTWNVPVTSVSGNGTLGLNKTSNTGISDTAGNALSGGTFTGQVYTVDQTAPTLTSITLANTSPTSATSLNFTATFSEAVSGVVAARFAKTGTLSGTGTIGTPTTSDGGITWNVPVTGVSGTGTFGIDKTSNTGVVDTAGNALTGGTVTGAQYSVDTVAPTVSSINRANTDPTSATTVNFTITFSESVTGVSASNFAVVGSGVTGSVGTVTGSGTTWNVPVTSVSGNGTIKVNLSANLSTIKDSVSNPLSVAFTTGQSYTIDQVAPTVSSINRTNTSPTNATTVNFTVTFSESVTGVSAANFSLVGSGVTGSIGTVTGSGTTYNVPVSSVSGTGTLRLDLTANLSSIRDSAYNPASASFTSGQSYTVDQTAPTCVSITRADANPTNATTLNFTVTFSEAVSGVVAARFAKTGTLSGTGTIGTPTTSDGGVTWNVPVTGVSGTGTLGIDKTSNTGVTDSVGNALTGGNVVGAQYNVVTIEKFFVVDTADTTVYKYDESLNATANWATSAANGNPTGIAADDSYVYVLDAADKIVYRYAYSGGTATASRVLRDNSGNALGATLNSIAVDGDDLWVADDSNNQLLRYSIATAFGGGGNYSALTRYAFGFGNGQSQGMALDSTYLYVLDAQDVVIYRYSRASGGTPTASRVFRTTGGGAIAGATGLAMEGDNVYVTQDAGTDVVYQYSLTSLYTGTGNLSAVSQTNLPAVNGNSAGIAVNPNPTVSSIVRGGSSPSSASSVTFTVTFSESVTGVDSSDFSLVTSGVSGASITSVSSDSGTTRTVTVNTGTGSGTIGLNFTDDDTVVDIANVAIGGNGAGNGNFTGEVYTIDRTAPTCQTITRTNSNPTNATTLSFTVTFSEAVSNVTASNFTKTGTLATTGTIGTPTSSDGGITWTVPVSGVIGNGTLGIDKTSNTGVTDSAGNALAGGNVVGEQYAVDQTAPYVISITRLDANPTNNIFVSYQVVFSEDVTGVDAGNFSLATTGGIFSLPLAVSGSGTTYTVTIGEIGNGTVRLDLDQNLSGITDLAGNPLNTPFTTGESYTLDQTRPTWSSITLTDTNPTSASTLRFTVTMSEAVTGVSASNFTKTGTLSGTGTIGTPTSSDGGVNWIVPVTGVTGNGTLGLNKTSNSGVQDLAGNTPNSGNLTGSLYTVDQVAPTVSSISRANTSPTSATSVGFTVIFSETVTGVATSNFTVVGSGVTGSVTGISGSGTTWTVTVSSISGTGTLRIDLDSNLSGIQDTATNPLAAAFTSGQSYTIDTVAPTVSSITRTNSNPTSATSVNFTVTFSEAVTGVSASNFALVGSGVTGTIGTVTGSGTTWNVPVTSVSGNGTLKVNLSANLSVIKDGSSNPMTVAFTTGESYTVDTIAPTVSSIVRADANPTSATSVKFTVVFSESVTSVTASNFSFVGSGATGTISSVTGSGTTWTVTVGSVSGNGTLGLNKTSNTGVYDLAINALSGGTVVGELYTIDQTIPTVSSIVRANTNPTSATTVNFTVTFSESVTGVSGANFTVVGSGVTGSVGTVTGSGTTWNVPVTSVSGNGTLRVDLTANLLSIRDSAYNPLSASFTAGQSYNIDQAAPVVSSIVRADANPTNATTVNFTVTFSESVTGVDATNFTVVGSGVTGTVGTVTGSGTTWNVPVTSVSGNGTLRVDLTANLSSVRDSAYNPLSASFTTGESYTIDQTAPTVSSIVRADANPTNATTVNFTVTFSESVTGVDATNFTVVGSGVTGTVGTVTGSGTTWNVPVTSVSGTGTLRVDLDQNLSN
ncbi:MAG: hypothetical protein K1X53_05745, partial [Candidatus Sumerlaeaceae bacterium]|nr:hypothetical protein [Candidatus Sumerlaeaceae bacterium]